MVKLLSLPDGLDYLMRPVLAGLCKMESLNNTDLDLLDFAIMNDALDVQAENDHRLNPPGK